MKDKITLSDGTEISWDEFSEMSEAEQNLMLNAPQKQQAKVCGKNVQIPDTLFPRLEAMSKRTGVPEDEILNYMQMMNELIFGAAEPNINSFSHINDHEDIFRTTKTSKIGKPVETPIGIFPSIVEAARKYGVHRQTIENWLLKRKPGFFYVNPEDDPV